MTVKAPKFRPDQVVVCVQAFAHPLGDVQAGARLRGDHEIVQAYAPYFVADGADSVDKWRAVVALHPDVEPAPEPRRTLLPPPLRSEDTVVCVRPCLGAVLGTRTHKSSPLAKEAKAHFVSVSGGVSRDRALLALETITNRNHDGSIAHQVLAGTWIDRDSPLVRDYPSLFVMPEY